jgi:membrane protease YdiL (CAAX protease family)
VTPLITLEIEWGIEVVGATDFVVGLLSRALGLALIVGLSARFLATGAGSSLQETLALRRTGPGGVGLIGMGLLLFAAVGVGSYLIDSAFRPFLSSRFWLLAPTLRTSVTPPFMLLHGLVNKSFLGPTAEELLFRVLLYGALRRRLAPWPAAFVSAVAFAAGHGVNWAATLSLLWTGLAYAWTYERSRSVLPPIVAHVLHNLGATGSRWLW